MHTLLMNIIFYQIDNRLYSLTESNIKGTHQNTKQVTTPSTKHNTYVPPVACVFSFEWTFAFLQWGHDGRVAGYVRLSLIPLSASLSSSGVAVPDSTSPMFNQLRNEEEDNDDG